MKSLGGCNGHAPPPPVSAPVHRPFNYTQLAETTKKTHDSSTMIFVYISQIVFNPLKLRKSISSFLFCRPMMKHYNCHKCLNIFQDDISCALVMYSYMWDCMQFWTERFGKVWVNAMVSILYSVFICLKANILCVFFN